MKQNRKINVLLLIAVRVEPNAEHPVDYEDIVATLRQTLERGEVGQGNTKYAWHVNSAKEAIAP